MAPQTLTLHATHTKWEEDRSQTNTPRINPAHVTFALSTPPEPPSSPSSNITGTITTEYLMTYLPDGNASFIFTERVSLQGLAEGKEGSFIAQGKGWFDGKKYQVTGEFEIVGGTGMGGLEGVKGRGRYGPSAEGGEPGMLEYVFEVEGCGDI